MPAGVALVTGASKNIGASIALAFASAGYDVAVVAKTDAAGGRQVAEQARERQVRAAPFLADMADPAQVEDLVGRVTSELGPVGVSVSNHGVRPRQRIPDTTPAEWDAVIRSNLSASFHLARPPTKPPISQARRCMSAAIITCRSRDARPSVGGQQEISARERLENN